MSPRNPTPDSGDYGDDMHASWSPEDTENVLRGHRPQSTDAAHLESAIAALRSRAHGTANDSAVAAMASILAEASLAPTRARRPRVPQAVVARAAAPWRRRASIAGVVAILASAGLAGTAAAADGAAPGDALYGVDRALEVIGIDNGGSRERLAEADKLAGRGDVQGALRHAAEALKGAGDASSSAALLAVAEQVADNGSGNSAEVKEQVSQMLRWMTTADVKGKDFGQTVNSYAHTMGASRGNATDDAGTPGNSGDTATTNGQGDSGSAGTSGSSGSSGKSGDAGKSNAGDKKVVPPSGGSGNRPGNGSGG